MKKFLCIVLSAAFAIIGAASALAFDKGPYLQNLTKTSVTVCWETDKPEKSVVKFALLDENGEVSEEGSVEAEAAEFSEIKLTGLKPGARYKYIVKSEDGEKDGGSFTTAPEIPVPFRFAAYGDTRTNHIIHAMNVKVMREYEPLFALNTGDLVTKGTVQEDWDAFWDVVTPLAADAPYYPCLGNHEHDADLYYKYFSLPENGKKERYYTFSYGNVFFMAIDSNAPHSILSEQKKWIKKELSKTRDFDYRVVFFHHPLFSSGKRPPNQNLRDIYIPIFKKYRVDLVLNGHDHFYERSVDENGITYVVTGGGGAPVYGFETVTPESLVREQKNHSMIFDVDDEKMTARTIDTEGKVFDTFTINADDR